MRACLVLLSFVASASAAKKAADPAECEVCKAVISKIDEMLTTADRASNEKIEAKMQTFCDGAKAQDKKMCYYMGVGDKTEGTAGGAKREISSSLGRGINAKRLCNRLKSKDGQMCELKYEKKIDPKTTDFTKLRVKELRKICEDEGINSKGFTEKDEFLKGLDGVALASDAFFPFRDSLDVASTRGVKYVVAAGGSVADAEVIAAADEYKMVMAFSGLRLFHH